MAAFFYHMETHSHVNQCPLVTVILPVRNEADYMIKSLSAVLSQDYPRDRMQIIVVDGGSDDHTAAIAEQVCKDDPRFEILNNPLRIVPVSMNMGFERARGTIIARVDGHCIIPRNYLSRCVAYLLKEGVDGVGGYVNTIGTSSNSRAIAAAMSTHFGMGGSAFRSGKRKTMLSDSVPFPVYTRSIMERAGPYDEELVRNQDDEYNYRIRAINGRLLLACDIESDYIGRSTLSSLWSQFLQYGYWKVRVLQKHPRQMKLRQFVPACFVAAMLTLGVLAPLSEIAFGTITLVVTAYLGANAIATGVTTLEHRVRRPHTVAAAYAIMHFGYGLGFLGGLIAFLPRWKETFAHTRASGNTPCNAEVLKR